MKIALAQIWQETNTFSPVSTDLSAFELNDLYLGAEIPEYMRGVGEIGGFLEALQDAGAGKFELVPILRAWAMSSGRVTSQALAFFEDTLLRGLSRSMPVDGVFLSLHGAAASESVDDLEGHLLSAVRNVVGGSVPVVASLDHHANITRRMVESADALLGYQRQPHDPFETGVRAAKVLFAALLGDISPCMDWQKIPMLAPADRGLTSEWPMKAWFELARTLEKQTGVISCSCFPVQPWLDVPELGWSAIVITDGNPELAQQCTSELANMAWELRHAFWEIRRLAPQEAIRRAVEAKHGPTIICDASDSVLSGAPGDGTCLLREMLEQGITCAALMPIVDPEVVELAITAGLGEQIEVRLGGKLDSVFGTPVELTARIAGVAEDGLKPLLHWGSANMGRTVLLEVGSIKVVVSEHAGIGGTHPDIYKHFGLEPAEAKIIVVKTYYQFQHFNAILKDVFMADCPGLSTWNLRQFQWHKAPRPLFPLDDLREWRGIPRSHRG
jgi:microcystin degradation protein MlrC